MMDKKPVVTREGDVSDQARNSQKLIYILDDNAADLARMQEQFNHFEYQACFFSSFLDLKKAVLQAAPDAMVLAIHLLDEKLIALIEYLVETLRAPLSIIYTSEKDTLNVRLSAVRYAGRAFIVKPVDAMSLASSLYQIFEIEKFLSYKVLIVAQSLEVARQYSASLTRAGMSVETVLNPGELFAHTAEFLPDVILMNSFLADCSGVELAQVMRQTDEYSAIPIVFISLEAGLSQKSNALCFEGDDCLEPSIASENLVPVIRSRAMRSKLLRSFMMRDSLTNLFNHAVIHQLLERELTRSIRYKNNLSLMLLDIDNFKKINDNFGHPVGDKVLRNFSLLLQQRLRKSDLIGRYGGEEFIVILPNTHYETAMKIAGEILQLFSKIEFAANNKTFFVTLSAGISYYPKHEDKFILIKAADNALYKAKETGKNRVVLDGG